MKSAFIVGFTGEVGKEVVKEAVARKAFSNLVLIGRRKVDYEDVELKNLNQTIVDFEQLEDYSISFKGFDVAFCCMGTTRGKAGADGFRKVDHDYIIKVAQLCKQEGCKEFHLVSSQGANKDSLFLYQKVKGETEEDLKNIGFERLVIYRPSLLLSDRAESRPAERFFKGLVKPITWAFPTLISIPTTSVAKVMVSKAMETEIVPLEILGNGEIHNLAAL